MARWDFALDLDRRAGVPLFLQIARALTDDIRRGRLRPGDSLPGTRTLAHSLGVQRLTVVSAYDEMVAEGWIETHAARGAFVSTALPDPQPRDIRSKAHARAGVPRSPGFDVPPGPAAEMPYSVPLGALLFAPNRPDVRLIPDDLVARAYRRALKSAGHVLLSYGRPQGHERLRAAVARMLSETRGLTANADDVFITRGSQMGLALVARALVKPGDVVAVEALTYMPAVEAFRVHGARVVPIPVDKEGLRIEPLQKLAEAGGLRLVHVTAHHQFPTTVTLSAARRLRLLDLARTHRVAVIEEDYDHEFHYQGRPVLPLASTDAWGVVVYVSTFSKVLAPAMRIGYVVAPPPLVASMVAHRLLIDIQGDRVLEHALAELIEEGHVQRHIRRVRREYAARRDVLMAELHRRLGDAIRFEAPAGGIGLWIESVADGDIDAWAARARDRGAVIVTARELAVDHRPRPFARLGFASLNREELAEGVRRLASAHRDRP
jgi:GntR family transcriptional regulator / MocR family aminotransferase